MKIASVAVNLILVSPGKNVGDMLSGNDVSICIVDISYLQSFNSNVFPLIIKAIFSIFLLLIINHK